MRSLRCFAQVVGHHVYRTAVYKRSHPVRGFGHALAYAKMHYMAKLLDEAIERLRRLPARMRDSAARTLILQLEEEPQSGDREAVAEGRRDFSAANS